MSLADKIRKARERNVEAGGFTFTVSRPTDVDMLKLRGNLTIDALLEYVTGWSGVKEIDLFPGGNPVPAVFDRETAGEWLADRPDIFGPLVEAIMQSYQDHVTERSEAAKN